MDRDPATRSRGLAWPVGATAAYFAGAVCFANFLVHSGIGSAYTLGFQSGPILFS